MSHTGFLMANFISALGRAQNHVWFLFYGNIPMGLWIKALLFGNVF